MPRFAVTERPYSLQVWEGGEWTTWSTYVHEANAADRAARLTAKGYSARVTGPTPKVVAVAAVAAACPHCDEIHPTPHDGRCLI